MTVWIYILAFLLFLLFLLFAPIRLSLSYREDLSLSLSAFFLPFSVYPRKKKVRPSDYTPRKMRKKRKKALRKRREAAAQEARTAKKKEKTLKQKLRALRLVLYILKNAYARILSAVRIRVHRFKVTVATDDAAKTALLYGAASGGVAALLEILESFTRTSVKRGGAEVVADFCGQSSKIDAKIVFSTNLYRFLGLALRAVLLFFKFKQKDAIKNNRNGGNQDERKQGE